MIILRILQKMIFFRNILKVYAKLLKYHYQLDHISLLVYFVIIEHLNVENSKFINM